MRTSHPLVAIVHPIRSAGYLFMAGVVGSTLVGRPTAPAAWVALAAHTLLWPQLAHALERRSERSKDAVRRHLLADAFLIGCWAPVLHFSLWPTTAILLSLWVGVLSTGGPRLALGAAAASAAGAGAVGLAIGLRYEPDAAWLNTWVSIAGITTYSTVFSYLSWVQARRLVQARKVADAQRTHIEETNALLEQARAAAEAASQAKSLFLANMSHELRTPLNAIIGYSEMAAEVLEGDEEAGELTGDLKKIGDAGKHLLHLIDGVLDLSRIEAGRMHVAVETFDVAAIVREVAGTAAPLVARHGNAFDVTCPDDVGRMRSDATKLKQILLNLLSNAGKFTERGRVALDVSRSADGAWLTFAVSDTGAGMTAPQVAQLFRPFTIIDPEATRRHSGTGLGLAISRRFCTLMGGDVEVTSEPGVGSTFTVRLPAASEDFASSGVFMPVSKPGVALPPKVAAAAAALAANAR